MVVSRILTTKEKNKIADECKKIHIDTNQRSKSRKVAVSNKLDIEKE